jgi:hypothetical protein
MERARYFSGFSGLEEIRSYLINDADHCAFQKRSSISIQAKRLMQRS